jgi:hypothetical protein
MTWRTTSDLDEFVAATHDLLHADVAGNTIILTTLENLAARGPHTYSDQSPRYGWWSPGGVVAGAYLQTPPFPVLLTELPDDALPALMETLDPVHVNADRALAEKIGEIWRRRTGVEPEVERRTRLYRLGQLVPPRPAPPGQARMAGPDDRDLLFDWHHRFHREVGEEIGDRTTLINDRISYGGLSLWEVDAVPVAMAGRTRASGGMIRLGPVFTPVELRSRGYGAAVTAAVSADAQQLAREVLLFTDLTNPISNAIYQRLGYQPVHDRWVVHCG